jgi:uncharacterized membrane protein
MMMRTVLALAPCLALQVAAPPAPWFRGVGDLPGGDVRSEVLELSSDGRALLGRSAATDLDEEGFLLRLESFERVTLGAAGGQRVNSQPAAFTADLRTIVGKLDSPRGPFEAGRWTEAEGWTGLGDLEGGDFISQAMDVSGDGRVVVGWGSSDHGLVAVRWVDGKPLELGDLPGGPCHAAAALVSRDGLTIAGTGTSERGPEVFRWRAETGLVALGDLPGGDFSSEPFAMTPDGRGLGGEATSEHGIEACVWTEAGGLRGLGDLPGGEFSSTVFALTADGSLAGGFGHTDAGAEAFLWDEAHGMRRVADMLSDAQLKGCEGWRLTDVTGLSADGSVLAGNGMNPQGQPEGWVARLR